MAGREKFRLRLITPARVVVDEDVEEVVAEDASGCFGVLARHERLVAALVPTIIRIEPAAGRRKYVAVDRGLLEKEGRRLSIAVRQAVVGDDYKDLERLIEGELLRLEESKARARSAFNRISISVMLKLFGYERGGP